MTIKQPLVIFPAEFMAELNNLDEYHTFIYLYEIYKDKEYKELPLGDIINEYQHLFSNIKFFEIQLKFFLIRNKFNNPTLSFVKNRIDNWIETVQIETNTNGLRSRFITKYETKFFSGDIVLTQENINKIYSPQYCYVYDLDETIEYVKSWERLDTTLDEWKKFNLIEILDFLPVFLNDQHMLKIQKHMKKLFHENVNHIINEIFAKRLEIELLREGDKLVLDRLFSNQETEKDKKYVNNIFPSTITLNYSILSKCMANEIDSIHYDIHSIINYTYCFVAIEYYKLLKSVEKKGIKNILPLYKKQPPKICIKNMPTNPKKKEEVHEALHNIFDAIHQHCPKASWIDFKLIFSQAGSSKKIIWPDNAQVLRFLFTKLGSSLECTPGRWEAVCHYFKPSENDVFDPKKLQSNSGYKDETLEKLINDFKNTLSQ